MSVNTFTPMDLLVETREALREGDPPPFRDRLAQWQKEIGSELRIGSVQAYRNRVLSFLSFHTDRMGKEFGSRLYRGSSILFDPIKQGEVKDMVEKAKHPHHKAIIGFLAQTGQRAHVLMGIKWGIIDCIKWKPYGIVSVPETLEDRKGRTVRTGQPYIFVIGRDTMALLDQWPETEKRKAKGSLVFDLSYRQIHRIVAEAAGPKGANVQDDSRHIMPGKTILYRVHPDAFPTYWFGRAKAGDMDRAQAKSMMGRDMRSEARDLSLRDVDTLLAAYIKAEPMLGLFEAVQ